jgi:hypothetical protein
MGAYAGVQLWRGEPIDGKTLAAAAVGGAVAGGLAGTTFGVGAFAGGASRATQFLAIDGAAASGSEKMAMNVMDKKALGDGVPEAAAWGAVTAPITGIALRGIASQLSQFAEPAVQTAASDAAPLVADARQAVTEAAPSEARMAMAALTTSAKVPSIHSLASTFANFVFGAPWLGEGVQIGKQGQHSPPVDPNTGVPGRPSDTKGINGAVSATSP